MRDPADGDHMGVGPRAAAGFAAAREHDEASAIAVSGARELGAELHGSGGHLRGAAGVGADDDVVAGEPEPGAGEDAYAHGSTLRTGRWWYNQPVSADSVRAQRRAEIVGAFLAVVAREGYAKASIAAIADEASVAPGLVHHYFTNKDQLLDALLEHLIARYLRRAEAVSTEEPLLAFGLATLRLDASADVEAARCWAGLCAEAGRDRGLARKLKRRLEQQLDALVRSSAGRIDRKGAAALIAFVFGALVVGSFELEGTSGFAAEAYPRLLDGS